MFGFAEDSDRFVREVQEYQDEANNEIERSNFSFSK